jgi:hypothetical protein
MSHLRQLKRQSTDLLAGLGKSPDRVAASLQEAGVRGVPQSNRSCPVALYLTAVLGSEARIHSVTVGHCSLLIHLVQPSDLRPAGRLLVQLPKPVRQFVAAFDARRYPVMVRERSAGAPVVAAGSTRSGSSELRPQGDGR